MMDNLCSQRFGRLIAVYPTKKRKNRYVIWKCICDCGNLKEIPSKNLIAGLIKSCGCLVGERNKQIKTTHGDTPRGKRPRLYDIWQDIKTRCLNPNCKSYKHYGSRGISVFDEWTKNYVAFRDWAMASGYEDNLTIDRINNDGNREPSNCQWITKSENLKKSHREREK